MDKALKEAIDKGRAAKEEKDKEARKALEAEQDKHQKYIDSYLFKANQWIKNILFAKIAETEASGTNQRLVCLGSGNTDGIPNEAIYKAAQKIKGLRPSYNCPPIYENAEFQGCGDPEYSIGWDSTDPNDNRTD